MPPEFEVRLRERPGEMSSFAFLGLSAVSDGYLLQLRGELDQAALHGVLERARALGLDVLEVRRADGSSPVTSQETDLLYEVEVAGVLGPAAWASFADLDPRIGPASTVLSGPLDQRGLHGVLDRIRALGLDLVGIRLSERFTRNR